ncbi:MAG: serine hydrolase, partial [Bacteroidota bacterium]
MKKIIKRILLLFILAGLVYGGSYAWRAFPIISGYGAKNLCSCVFVAGREESSVLKLELGSLPLSLGTFYIDKEEKAAYGNVFGMAVKKAIFRERLGCTLISELTENEVRAQSNQVPKLTILPDSLDWPFVEVQNTLSEVQEPNEKLFEAVDRAFVEDNPEQLKNTRAVLVIQNGQILAEKYSEGFNQDTPQIGWSMTKSITNAMIGLLVKDGDLDIYSPAPIEGWQGENDPRNKITIDHLLRMSSGLYWEEEYAGPSSATNMLFKSADMGDVAINQSLAYPPDTQWYYSSGTSNILSKIVHQTIGDQNYHEYVRKRLFDKIGASSVIIEPDASGTYVGSSYMYATPRDW